MAAKFVRLTTRTARRASLERLGQGRVISGGFRQVSRAEGLEAVSKATAGGSKALFCAADLMTSVAKAVKSVTDLEASVMDSEAFVADLTVSIRRADDLNSSASRSVTEAVQSVMESVKSVTEASESVVDLDASITDLTAFAADVTAFAAHLIPFAAHWSLSGREAPASALPMTLSVPDLNTSATDQPRYRERGFRTPAWVFRWATSRHACEGVTSLFQPHYHDSLWHKSQSLGME